MTQIAISTEFIKLDAFLKFASAVCSGGEAKIIIAEGMVQVNGECIIDRMLSQLSELSLNRVITVVG